MDRKGPIYILICYILYGLSPLFWKLLAAVDSFYVLTVRIVWSFLLLTVVLAVRRNRDAVRAVAADRRELARLFPAGIFVCLNWGSYILAVNSGHVLDASLAYYMHPILAVLLGTVVFREKLTKLQWLSVAVSVTGLMMVVVRSGQFPWLALLIGGSFAVYGALKKGVRAESVTSMFFETLVLAPFALAFMILSELRGSGAVGVLRGVQWLLLPAAGVVTTVPLMIFARGIKTTPMALSGILMYINPTLQLLLSVWLYQEEFTTNHTILFCFIWSGLALYLLSGFVKERRKPKEEDPCA